jgi:hypothetical protein
MLDSDRLEILIRHIENVKENAILLVDKMRQHHYYSEDFYRKFLKAAFKHDNSKFSGVEWEYLHGDIKISNPENFQLAAEHHVYTNNHHPEYWGGIENMPLQHLAVLVCDWKSRSEEFGNDFIEWIDEKATLKYNFDSKSRVYKVIMNLAKLLVEKQFE